MPAWNSGLSKVPGSGRTKGTPNKKTTEEREQTQDFFRRIVDDEIEAKFWRYFITGYEMINLPNGSVQIVPIPLNPVSFSAFKRAVEYKRGLPVQPVADVTNLILCSQGLPILGTENSSAD